MYVPEHASVYAPEHYVPEYTAAYDSKRATAYDSKHATTPVAARRAPVGALEHAQPMSQLEIDGLLATLDEADAKGPTYIRNAWSRPPVYTPTGDAPEEEATLSEIKKTLNDVDTLVSTIDDSTLETRESVHALRGDMGRVAKKVDAVSHDLATLRAGFEELRQHVCMVTSMMSHPGALGAALGIQAELAQLISSKTQKPAPSPKPLREDSGAVTTQLGDPVPH